jgi:hypothetical protein
MFVSDKHAALFDLLTWTPAYANGDTCPGDLMREVAEQRELAQSFKDNLGQTARWHGQEFSMEVKDDSWVITIFSCFDRGEGEPDLLKLIIPKDKQLPVRLETYNDEAELVVPERKVVVRP